MSDKSGIQWTDATWNPTRGCSRVSPGCGGPGHAGGCYAETIAARFSDPGAPYHGFAERGRPGSKWTGKVALIDDMLTVPLRWKKPRRIFVNSMSDLFHEALSDSDIDKVFAVMALCPQHTFQVLTKRAARMRDYFKDQETRCGDIAEEAGGLSFAIGRFIPKFPGWPLPNVWLGVSVEDQERADERIPLLLETPSAVRFLSCEPLLGPLDLDHIFHERAEWLASQRRSDELCSIDWAICGGESGPKARDFNIEWARSIRDQCKAAGIACFIKQFGAQPYEGHGSDGSILRRGISLKDRHGGDWDEWPADLRIREFPSTGDRP